MRLSNEDTGKLELPLLLRRAVYLSFVTSIYQQHKFYPGELGPKGRVTRDFHLARRPP